MQLAAHPLHGRIYADRPVPRPHGCRSRAYRLVGVLRTTPAFEDLLDVRVVRAPAALPLLEDGESAVVALVADTDHRVHRSHRAPFLRSGDRVRIAASRCTASQLLARRIELVR